MNDLLDMYLKGFWTADELLDGMLFDNMPEKVEQFLHQKGHLGLVKRMKELLDEAEAEVEAS